MFLKGKGSSRRTVVAINSLKLNHIRKWTSSCRAVVVWRSYCFPPDGKCDDQCVVLFFRTDPVKTHGARSDGIDFSIKVSRISSFMLSTGKWSWQGVHWSLCVPSLSEKEKKIYKRSTSIDFTTSNNTPNILKCFLVSKPYNGISVYFFPVLIANMK